MFSGDQLKTARLAKQLSQEELGQLLNVNKMTISNWEKGKNTPNQKHFEQLLSLFGVTADYFNKDHRLLIPFNQLLPVNKEKLLATQNNFLINKYLSLSFLISPKTLFLPCL